MLSGSLETGFGIVSKKVFCSPPTKNSHAVKEMIGEEGELLISKDQPIWPAPGVKSAFPLKRLQ